MDMKGCELNNYEGMLTQNNIIFGYQRIRDVNDKIDIVGYQWI